MTAVQSDLFVAAGSSIPVAPPSIPPVRALPARLLRKPRKDRGPRSQESIAKGKTTRAVNAAIHACSVLLADGRQAAIAQRENRPYTAVPSPFRMTTNSRLAQTVSAGMLRLVRQIRAVESSGSWKKDHDSFAGWLGAEIGQTVLWWEDVQQFAGKHYGGGA